MITRRTALFEGGAAVALAALAPGTAFGRLAGDPTDAGAAARRETMTTDLSGGIPAEREFVLAKQPDQPGMRDATNVWIEEANGAFGIRIGVEAVTEAWDKQMVWLDVAFPDGRLISYRSESAPIHSPLDAQGRPMIRGAGPARFTCIDPFKRWDVSFHGEAADITTQAVIDNMDPVESKFVPVDIDVEMTMAVPPWMPGSLLPEAAAILQGEQGEMMSPRYEQLCRVVGSVRIGDRTLDLAGQGLRIRRTGPRAFSGFWGHCWQSALFPSGKAFGFNIYPPRKDGKPSYAEGFVFDGAGTLVPARPVQVPWMRKLVTTGEPVPLVLETVDGRRVEIDGTSFTNVRSRGSAVLPPEFPIVQQAHVEYRWDGETSTGMMERSTLPDSMTL